MLDIAFKHEEELKKLFLETWHNDFYKFWTFGCFSDQYEAAKNTWEKSEFVSLDSSGNVIGYIAYDVDRNTRNVSGLSALNFSENKVVFGRDLLQAMKDVFEKYRFRKIEFSVICGNPIERSYDRLAEKFGGRIVGIKTDHCRLIDGKYYDLKLYEVMNPNRRKTEDEA
jgi:hypothetical protein